MTHPALFAPLGYTGEPVVLTVHVDKAGKPRKVHVSQSGEVAEGTRTLLEDWAFLNVLFFSGYPGEHTLVGELLQTEWRILDYYWEGDDAMYDDRIEYLLENTLAKEDVSIRRIQ